MATFTATERRAHLLAAVSHGGAYTPKVLLSTVEITTATTVGRTISFGRIPSNARILGASKLYWDDLATSGSPTLDLGLAAVNGNLVNADDPNALLDAGAISSASTGALVVTDHANLGLPAWDYVASETADPGGELEVYGSLVDAPINAAGTITLELHYVVD
jgi:hypothetical protein